MPLNEKSHYFFTYFQRSTANSYTQHLSVFCMQPQHIQTHTLTLKNTTHWMMLLWHKWRTKTQWLKWIKMNKNNILIYFHEKRPWICTPANARSPNHSWVDWWGWWEADGKLDGKISWAGLELWDLRPPWVSVSVCVHACMCACMRYPSSGYKVNNCNM